MSKPEAMEVMSEMLVASEQEFEAMRTELQLERVARATAEGALQAEREARTRAEADRDQERTARVAAEIGKAAAEQQAQPKPAEQVTVVETGRPPVPWKFKIVRDGARDMDHVLATPEGSK